MSDLQVTLGLVKTDIVYVLFLIVKIVISSFGRESNNQNGNLRWFSPLGVGPPRRRKTANYVFFPNIEEMSKQID